MKSSLIGRAALAGMLLAAIAGAQTGTQVRSWVSSAGSDLNPCTQLRPCATFAGALTKTAPGGEVDVQTSGEYGPVTIVGSVTIDGSGGATITAPSGGYGIKISASGATVAIRNVEIIGTQGQGSFGVYVGSAGMVNLYGLEITNCDHGVLSFSGGGILLQGVTITGGSSAGINLVPAAGLLSAVVNATSVTVANGGTALEASVGGGSTVNAVVTGSTFSGGWPIGGSSGSNYGLVAYGVGGSVVFSVSRSWIQNFSADANSRGVWANGGNSVINLANNVIQNNSNGLVQLGGGVINSYVQQYSLTATMTATVTVSTSNAGDTATGTATADDGLGNQATLTLTAKNGNSKTDTVTANSSVNAVFLGNQLIQNCFNGTCNSGAFSNTLLLQ